MLCIYLTSRDKHPGRDSYALSRTTAAWHMKFGRVCHPGYVVLHEVRFTQSCNPLSDLTYFSH